MTLAMKPNIKNVFEAYEVAEANAKQSSSKGLNKNNSFFCFAENSSTFFFPNQCY